MNKVTVGPGTVAGFAFSGAAFVGAIVAFFYGDRSEQTLTVIASGVLLAVTIVGRQWQAVNNAKAEALVQSTTVINAPLSPADVATLAAIVERMAPVIEEAPHDPPDPALEFPAGSVPT